MTCQGSANSSSDRDSRREIGRLKKRAEYLAAKSGRRISDQLFTLQVRRRDSSGTQEQTNVAPRFGYTVTTRTGSAVVRNRIRRRLKHAVALVGPSLGLKEHDHVLIARRAVVDADFDAIVTALRQALNRAASNPYPPHQRRRRQAGNSHSSGQAH